MRSLPDTAATTLATTQRAFAAALDDAEAVTALLPLLGGAADSNRRRLRAYRRNVVGNWIGALRSTCPAVAAALGDTRFAAIARAYALAHPSPSGNLDDYGADFAGFLALHADLPPWLPDLARLERALQDAYYAADADALDFAALATLPPEDHGRLRFRLAASFRPVVSDWPLAELWRQLLQDGHPGDAEPRTRTTWVVRQHGQVRAEAASAGEAAFVAALAAQATLDQAIEQAAAADPGFDVGRTLVRLAALDLLSGFTLAGEE